MAFKFDLIGKVVKCLQENSGTKFTAKEIAQWIYEKYPEDCQQKMENATATVTPIDNVPALLNQIAAEIGSRRPFIQKNYSQIKTTDSRPRNYYFTELTDIDEIKRAEIFETSITPKEEKPVPKEESLYQKLSNFLWLEEPKIHSMRIDEKKSKNSRGAGGNQWLHPDLVGIQDIGEGWHTDIKNLAEQSFGQRARLWSFEVKSLINLSNARDAYFQAVINSSWANLGYLVASEIQENAMKELRILASLHGIGLIQLNAEDPSESEFKILAKERSAVDWDVANRLATINKDFLEYIKLISEFYKNDRIKPAEWDAQIDED